MYNIKVTILSSSEWHWALSHWCTTITAIRFWNFFIFPNWQFFPSTQWLIIPCTHKLCAPCCLSGLGSSSSTWDNASALRVRRLLLSTVFARFTQVIAGVRISSFLRLVNTPVCGWATFCLPVHPFESEVACFFFPSYIWKGNNHTGLCACRVEREISQYDGKSSKCITNQKVCHWSHNLSRTLSSYKPQCLHLWGRW